MLGIFKRAWRTARRDGPSIAYRKASRRFLIYRDAAIYRKWADAYDTLSENDERDIRKRIDQLSATPLISILMPVYNVKERWLRKAIESVRDQVYTHWELCIADDHSTAPHVKKVLEEYGAMDKRIKVVLRESNGHISAASNSALELATGEFTALLDHDDQLAVHALYMIAQVLNSYPDTDMIFSDEDKIDAHGRRFDPRFKPDWSPDTFYSVNYTNHLSAYRTSLLREVGGFRVGYDGSQDYDLALRVIETTKASNIRHVPHVLYHWRAIPGSVALASGEKDYPHERARASLNEHFERSGVAAKSVRGVGELHRTVPSFGGDTPLVSVIVFGGGSSSEAIENILAHTDYESYELLVTSNNVEDKIPKNPRVKVFESGDRSLYEALNNAANNSTGTVLCFVEGSTAIKTTDWLRELVGHAIQKEIGAVSLKIRYSNDKIKHAGLLLGIRDGVGRAHYNFNSYDEGRDMRLVITQNFSAVSIDCLAVRKEIFEEVGRFDAKSFPSSFADVDLCLRLREAGYRNVWTPWAEIVQSDVSAINDPIQLERLRQKWVHVFDRDPYFNPNFSNQSEDFSLSFPPRLGKFSL